MMHGLANVKFKMLCFWTAVCVTELSYFSQSSNGVSGQLYV